LWIEYRLIFGHDADVDTILFLLLEQGFEGSYEDVPIEAFHTADGYGYRQRVEKDIAIVTFSKQEFEERQWMEWFSKFGLKKTEAKNTEEQTGEEWKETFSPLTISSTIQLVPEWMKAQVDCEAEHCLYIEPGAAFGTGLHGSTQDCMRIMETLPLTGKRVLDLGSGSGILSILAKKMGASHVCAVDLNPSAELELQKNMRYNLIEEGIDSVIGDMLTLELPKVDVVICNIGLKENIELLPQLINCLQYEGWVISSGIAEWGEAKLTQEFAQQGFKLSQRRQTGEWVSCLFGFSRFIAQINRYPRK
jgi:ribosomal protein L11 methyltransferase